MPTILTPEEKARVEIDRQLEAAGWQVQDRDNQNLFAQRGTVVEGVEGAIAANLKRAERLRQAVLRQAFEGRLVPQDPSDEPASVLLERIRQAKGKKQQGNQMRLPGV